jgi:hypothetical protein
VHRRRGSREQEQGWYKADHHVKQQWEKDHLRSCKEDAHNW